MFGRDIGLVVQEEKYTGPRSEYYKKLNRLDEINWDWNELQELLKGSCPVVPIDSEVPEESGSQ